MIYYLGLFILNLLIESSVAFLMGRRSKYDYLAVLAVNAATHPTFTLILMVAYRINLYSKGLVIVLEIVIVIVEGLLLMYMYHSKEKKYLYQSLFMNGASLSIGLIINFVCEMMKG